MNSKSSRRNFLKSTVLASAPLLAGAAARGEGRTAETQPSAFTRNDRAKWLAIVERVSQPVLEAISQQRLRATMPVETAPGMEEARRRATHLEAVARLLSGLAPSLEASRVTIPPKSRCAAAIANGRGWPFGMAPIRNRPMR